MNQNAINLLKKGGVGIIATDTLYGLVGSALNKETVERIYQIKGRSENKPFIILISSIEDLRLFDILIDEKVKNYLKQTWPSPVSVILPCPSEKFAYLHKETQNLAFRLPDDEKLLDLLKETGPLVAPSANPQGKPPAQTIEEAKKYFGDNLDFYSGKGKLTGSASTLIQIKNDEIKILRQGTFTIGSLKLD